MYIYEYLTMECIHKPCTSTMNYETGQRVSSEEVVIKCFKYGDKQLVKDGTGQGIMSNQHYITLADVKVGDFIDGHEVKRVTPNYDFDGTLLFYEVLI